MAQTCRYPVLITSGLARRAEVGPVGRAREACERVVATELDPPRLDWLFRIGVDEISWRKHHKYLTPASGVSRPASPSGPGTRRCTSTRRSDGGWASLARRVEVGITEVPGLLTRTGRLNG